MTMGQEEKKNSKAPQHKDEGVVTLKESEYLGLKEEADKAKEYWEKMLRIQADCENARKRLERDKQDFLKFANESIIVELLNVLDDLERTVELAESGHQDMKAFLKGIEMILSHLYDMIKDNGVKPIGAAGKIFDPHYHEALMQVVNNDLPEHTIIEEMQKGYLLNDKVIRTSKVKVSVKSEP